MRSRTGNCARKAWASIARTLLTPACAARSRAAPAARRPARAPAWPGARRRVRGSPPVCAYQHRGDQAPVHEKVAVALRHLVIVGVEDVGDALAQQRLGHRVDVERIDLIDGETLPAALQVADVDQTADPVLLALPARDGTMQGRP